MTSPASRNDIGYSVRTAAGAVVERRVNPAGEYVLEPGDQLVRAWGGAEPPMLRMMRPALDADYERSAAVQVEREAQHLPPVFDLLRNTVNGPQPLGPYGYVKWQDGPVPEVGVNGTTLEDVIKLAEHRLEEFQAGPFPCEENVVALRHLHMARLALEDRTRNREAQGVEGREEPHAPSGRRDA